MRSRAVPRRPSIVSLAETLVAAFGEERFTLRGVWSSRRVRDDCYAALFAGWAVPTVEWDALARDLLARSGCSEAVPGPRGGEGWRVPSEVVARVRRETGERERRARREAEEARAAAAALASNHAAVTVDERHGRVRATYPDAVGAAVARCAALQRPRGLLSASGGTVSCELRDAARLAAALPFLDAAAEREAARLLPRHEAALAELRAIMARASPADGSPVRPKAGCRPSRSASGRTPAASEHVEPVAAA